MDITSSSLEPPSWLGLVGAGCGNTLVATLEPPKGALAFSLVAWPASGCRPSYTGRLSKSDQEAGTMVRVASAGSNEEASILRSYLEHHGIQVYVQGENHRSMLGMVGAYIDLHIMVPAKAAEEAKTLLEEFHAAEDEGELADGRGPFRDEDDDDEDDDDESSTRELELRRAVRGARMVGLFLPFGTAHMAAGARRPGLVFIAASLAGFVMGIGSKASLGLLWPIAVVLDFLLVPSTLRRRRHAQQTPSSNHTKNTTSS